MFALLLMEDTCYLVRYESLSTSFLPAGPSAPITNQSFPTFTVNSMFSLVSPVMPLPHLIPSRAPTILLTISHSSQQLAGQRALAAAHLGLGMCSF